MVLAKPMPQVQMLFVSKEAIRDRRPPTNSPQGRPHNFSCNLQKLLGSPTYPHVEKASYCATLFHPGSIRIGAAA